MIINIFGQEIAKYLDKSNFLINFPKFQCNYSHYQGTVFTSKFHFYQYFNIHKIVTKANNIIKQYYCLKKRLKCLLLSKRNNLEELLCLFKINRSCLISSLSLISRAN